MHTSVPLTCNAVYPSRLSWLEFWRYWLCRCMLSLQKYYNYFARRHKYREKIFCLTFRVHHGGKLVSLDFTDSSIFLSFVWGIVYFFMELVMSVWYCLCLQRARPVLGPYRLFHSLIHAQIQRLWCTFSFIVISTLKHMLEDVVT